MERVEKALTEKQLSALSVGKDFIPETDGLIKDSGSKRRKGGMHLEADFGGEQDCGIDSRGAMSGVESSCGEVEQDLPADSNTPSCSHSMLQERHEEEAALICILPYADLKSLLTLERVSKHMRSEVNDVLLMWRKLEVEPPLSSALTDDILMTLVKRTGGLLKVVRLVGCSRITDDGLFKALPLCPQIEEVCNISAKLLVLLFPVSIINFVSYMVFRAAYSPFHSPNACSWRSPDVQKSSSMNSFICF
ncbi:hypothetical protein MPTK2_5g21040 [Marchantia polymorpha subsp. ruderalis]